MLLQKHQYLMVMKQRYMLYVFLYSYGLISLINIYIAEHLVLVENKEIFTFQHWWCPVQGNWHFCSISLQTSNKEWAISLGGYLQVCSSGIVLFLASHCNLFEGQEHNLQMGCSDLTKWKSTRWIVLGMLTRLAHPLTHWGQVKMAAIFQMTFSNVFPV